MDAGRLRVATTTGVDGHLTCGLAQRPSSRPLERIGKSLPWILSRWIKTFSRECTLFRPAALHRPGFYAEAAPLSNVDGAGGCLPSSRANRAPTAHKPC